jgi:two-component system response regulator CpxR
MNKPSETTPRPRLLIIDDDVELCQLLSQFLHVEGFELSFCHQGEKGLQEIRDNGFDLVLLDVMLPGINGFDVLRQMRTESAVPVIMLTAKGEDIDRIVGLELGADDYLPKPFNTRELLARVHAILRRTRNVQPGLQASSLSVGDVEVDVDARVVRREGSTLELTGLEFDLLCSLLRNAGKVVQREVLFKEVLGRAPMPDDRSLDMHISNLRKKLGHYVNGTERIKTVRGQGYVYART